MNTRLRLMLATMLAGALGTNAQPPAPEATVTPLMTKPLAGVPGKEVLMLTVAYPPGGASAAHRHNASTLVYVLEGSVVMQVAGADLVTLRTGETFFETPDDIHAVSRNASATAPAKLLVTMVKEVGAPPTLPVSP